jgi:hypothetical protein
MAAFQPATSVRRAAAIFNPLRSRRNLREKFTVQIEVEDCRHFKTPRRDTSVQVERRFA